MAVNTSTEGMIRWPDLSFYGLRLMQARIGDRDYVVALGDVDEYDEQLDALGFRPHARQQIFVRANNRDRPLRLSAIEKAFPEVRLGTTHREQIQLRLKREAPATGVAPDSAPQGPGKTGNGTDGGFAKAASAVAMKALEHSGIAPKLAANRDGFYEVISSTATDKMTDFAVESHAAGDGYEIVFAADRIGHAAAEPFVELVFYYSSDGALEFKTAQFDGDDPTLDPKFAHTVLSNMYGRMVESASTNERPSADSNVEVTEDAQRSDDAANKNAGGSSSGGDGPAVEGDARADGSAGDMAGEAATDDGSVGTGQTDQSGGEPAEVADPDDDTTGAGRRNYRLTDPELVASDSYRPGDVVRANLAALRTLKLLEDAGESADAIAASDGDTLIRFAGWGGAADVFTSHTSLHRTFHEQIKEVMSDAEQAAAGRSTLNAHYTPTAIIDAIWQATAKAGFAGGVALEPGAGSGLFLAREPGALADDTRWHTVERDALSNRLLHALYPDAQHHGSYEKAPIGNNRMDLVIGNVPFGNYRVHDPAYRKAGLQIHDYFIVKSLDKLRPGGVMAVITSSGTLDKHAPKAREMMYARGDLVAAARLPEDAFAANAGATVTTDILFFRKRLPGEEPQPFDWKSQVEIQGADGEMQRVNAVFNSPRGTFLGHPVRTSGQFGPRNAVVRRDPRTGEKADMDELLKQVVAVVPAGILSSREAARAAGWDKDESVASAGADAGNAALLDAFSPDAEGCFVITDDDAVGEVYQGSIRPLEFANAKSEQRVRGMIAVRERMLDVMRSQLDDVEAPAFDDALVAFNATYDTFVKEFGYLSARVNRRLFVDDPYSDLLLAAEDYDPDTEVASKADVFRERTLPTSEREHAVETVRDALLVSLQTVGKVDPQVMERLLGKPWTAIREELADEVCLNPETGDWEPAAKFLSGDVRRLAGVVESAAASESDPAKQAEYERSLAAVRAAVPQDVTQDEIMVTLGVPWVGADVVRAFIRHIYDDDRIEPTVAHNSATAEWQVKVPGYASAPAWGTNRVDAAKIIECSLKGQPAKVMDRDFDTNRYYVNETATAAAMERQNAIETEFRKWIWSDVDRAERLVSKYNRIFNSQKAPDYSNLPMDVAGRNPLRTFRDEQASAITRIVMESDTLLAHPVGYGKTATMAGASMKLRQLGLAQKPMIVARKNTLQQTASEIVRWFPKARPLVIESADLSPKGRNAFWRRVQTRNPDVIVVTPEAFKRIPLSPESEAAYLDKEITEMKSALEAQASDDSNDQFKRTRKQIEKRLADTEAKLQDLLNADEKDPGAVTFERLGVDALFVDESQNYKNLQVHTRERLLGVPTAASQRAFDMAAKVWSVRSRGGRVVFATGTPITNSLVEAYTIQRYLQPEMLERMGIDCFDAWKAQFAAIKRSLEPDPGGSGYREVSRLAEIVNVPELVQALAVVTDAVDESKSHVVKPSARFNTIVSEPSEMQQLYRKVLAERVQAIKNRGGQAEQGQDNILVVLGEARRAALDLKTLFPDLSSSVSGSKITALVEEVMSTWKASSGDKGTQCVFLDFATPGRKDAWDGYAEIADRLVAAGMPREQIAFVHDAKSDAAKGELFARVRNGDVRVILGSTEKMGEGTNMQDRLTRLHHMNAPFHPGHMIQRNGRILRQGNRNKEVEITTYVTRGLLEDWNWHLVTTKEAFIQQIFAGLAAHTDGKGLARRITDDVMASMNYDEIEASASDNPLVKERCKAEGQIRQLELERDGFASRRAGFRSKLTRLKDEQDYMERLHGRLERTLKHVEPAPETFALSINGAPKPIEGYGKAGAAVLMMVAKFKKAMGFGTSEIGTVRGLTMEVKRTISADYVLRLFAPALEGEERVITLDISNDEVGMAKRIDNAIKGLDKRVSNLSRDIEGAKAEQQRLTAEVECEWPKEAELSAIKAESARLGAQLAEMNKAVGSDAESPTSEFLLALRKHDADERVLAHLDTSTQRDSEPCGWDDDASLDDDEDAEPVRMAASPGR